MATITRSYPAQWAQRMAPAVAAKIKHVENHRVIHKLLAARGKESITELSAMDQAEVLVDLMFWQITAEHEAERAKEDAYRTALDASIDQFEVGE